MPAEAILRHEWAFGAAESCGACTPCRVGTRQGSELAHRIAGPGADGATVLAQQEPLLEVMDVASLCAFGRGVAGAIRSVSRAYSAELHALLPHLAARDEPPRPGP
jgi:NADH-quinone oxidoreductase subunit F